MLTCLSWDATNVHLHLIGRVGRFALVILRHHAYDVPVLRGVLVGPQVSAAPLPLGALHDELSLLEAPLHKRVDDLRLRIPSTRGFWNY